MPSYAREESLTNTVALSAEAASLIVLGRISVVDSDPDFDGSVRIAVDSEEVLKGTTEGPRVAAVLPPQEDAAADPPLGQLADGYRGLLFLGPRVLDPNDPDAPLFLQPGDPALSVNFGLDPDLAADAPSFGELRAHLERLLALRRARLEIALGALAGRQPRLRSEAAFDVERFEDLATLLRADDLDVLFSALADPALPDEPRIALLRALARVPAAASLFLDTLRALVVADFVAGGFRIQAGQLLVEAADPQDFDLFRRYLDADSPLERGVGLAGLIALGTPEALGVVAATAAEHPDPATRDLAADLLRSTGS